MDSELVPIPSFPGYSITLDERVWDSKRNRWLKTNVVEQWGYRMVNLRRDDRYHLVAIHRLLLETFVGPCPEGMECRHLDSNKLNNDLDNLCWGTHYKNMQDRTEHGPLGYGNSKLNEYKVSWIKQLLDTGRFTQRKIAEVFGVCQITISKIKNGDIWTRVA